jgi:RNA polymerase sigma-70 factor (sigma-E family)
MRLLIRVSPTIERFDCETGQPCDRPVRLRGMQEKWPTIELASEGVAGVTSSGRGAVEELFESHYDAMCRLAFVILGDSWLAEEIVMEALLRTYSGWGRIREPERADIYLRRAVVNLCRSRIRRAILERRAPVVESHERSAVDDFVERDEVLTAVRALPERQRACVVLRYYEDLGERQIAEILDCSIGTVKSQLHKARASLAHRLGESHD